MGTLLLAACNPGSAPSGPAPAQPAAPTQATQSATLALSLDPSAWWQEYIAQGGAAQPKLDAHPHTANCPAGELCELLPDRSTNVFASYLLYDQPDIYSVTTADPVPRHAIVLSGYRTLTLTIEVMAPSTAQFKYDSEPGNTGATTARIRPFLAQERRGGKATNPDETSRWFALDPATKVVNGGEIDDSFSIVLKPGTFTVTVPLDGKDWESVFTKRGDDSTLIATPNWPPCKIPTPACSAAAGWKATLDNTQYIGLVFGGGFARSHGVAVTGGSAEVRVTSYELGK